MKVRLFNISQPSPIMTIALTSFKKTSIAFASIRVKYLGVQVSSIIITIQSLVAIYYILSIIITYNSTPYRETDEAKYIRPGLFAVVISDNIYNCSNAYKY